MVDHESPVLRLSRIPHPASCILYPASPVFLRVLHRTRYLYRVPVSDSINEVRLRPATDDPRRLTSFILRVHPPRRLRHFRDGHFNYVQWFEIPEPHSELMIEATSCIHTTSQFASGDHSNGAYVTSSQASGPAICSGESGTRPADIGRP